MFTFLIPKRFLNKIFLSKKSWLLRFRMSFLNFLALSQNFPFLHLIIGFTLVWQTIWNTKEDN